MLNTCSSIYVSEGKTIHKVTLKGETESKLGDSILKSQHWFYKKFWYFLKLLRYFLKETKC